MDREAVSCCLRPVKSEQIWGGVAATAELAAMMGGELRLAETQDQRTGHHLED